MKHFSKGGRLLAFLLAVLMVVSALPLAAIGAFAADAGAGSGGKTTDATNAEVRAVLLDSGRKYFSVKSVKTLIDFMAEYKFNQLQLVIGNGGCRFLLDDMSLSFSDTTLSSDTVKAGIKAGNEAFNSDESYWDETKMGEILAYAKEKNIEIVPMLNMPGHSTAIAKVLQKNISDYTYDYINVSNETAREYAKALLKKYVEYFAGEGCKTFSFGADEYGKAVDTSVMETFLNDLAKIIKAAKMTPRAFNDAYNYNMALGGTGDDKVDVEIAYWYKNSPYYGTYKGYAEAATLAKNYKMINTNGCWYYVVKDYKAAFDTNGKSEENSKYYLYGTSAAVELPSYKCEGHNGVAGVSAACFPENIDQYYESTSSKGSRLETNFGGTMFCIWCDNSTALKDTQVLSEDENYGALYQLTWLAKKYWGDELKSDTTEAPATETDAEVPNEVVTEPATEPETLPANTTVDITLTVGGKSEDYTYEWSSEGASDWLYGELVDGYGDKTIAKPNVEVKTEIETEIIEAVTEHYEAVTEIVEEIASEPATSLSSDDQIAIGDGTNWLKLNGSTLENTTNKDEATLWTVSKSGSSYTLKSGDNYLHIESSGDGYSLVVDTSSTSWSYSSANGFSKSVGFFWWLTTYYITYSNNAWKVSETSGSAKAYKQVKVSKIVTSAYDKEITPASTKTTYKSTTTVSFEALKVGTTAFYLKTTDGKTVKYNITVGAEDISNAEKLKVELWITNNYVGATKSQATVDGHILTISATSAYGENGVTLASLVYGDAVDDQGREVSFWKGTILTSANKQTKSGSDMTEKGEDYYYVRYWDGIWSYLNEDAEWVAIDSSEQVVAYYMQRFEVSPEINVVTRDYGSVMGEMTSYARTPSYQGTTVSGFMTFGMAVVYPDSSMSPDGDEGIWDETLQCLFIWNSGTRTPGIVVVNPVEGYRITKITMTHGSAPTDRNTEWTQDNTAWEKELQADNTTYWYKETLLWSRSEDDTSSDAIQFDDEDWGTEWAGTDGDMFLMLVYVEAVKKEDNLTVKYVDDSSATPVEVTDYQINVVDGINFRKDLNISGVTGGLTAGNINLATGKTLSIANNVGTAQGINYERLALVAGVADKYKTGKYKYTYAEISEDGKTLTFHYSLKDTLKVQYYYRDADGDTLIDLKPDYLIYVTDITFANGTKVQETTQVMTVEQLMAAIKAGKTLTITGVANTAASDESVAVPIYTTLTDLVNNLKSRIDIDSTHNRNKLYEDIIANTGDYYFAEAKLNSDNTLLALYFSKYIDLDVIYRDDTKNEDIIPEELFATTKGVTFKDSYAKIETVTITDKNGETQTVEIDLSELGKTGYEDYYFDGYTVSADGKTLTVHYKKYKTLSVVWKVQGTDTVIKPATSEGLTKLPYNAAWDKDTLKVENGGEGFSYTAETDLNNLTGLNDDMYKTYYEYVKDSAEVEGDTLILYYAKKTTTIIINWIDESKTADKIIDSKTLTVELEEAEKLATFTKDSTLTIKDTAGKSYTITIKLSDNSDIKAPYTDDAYYFVSEDKANGNKTLNLHYDKYKTMTVHWVERLDKDTEIGQETISKVWSTGTWNSTTFAIDNGKVTYTASKDISKFGGDYKYYSYITHEVKGNDLYFYYGYETVYVEWRVEGTNTLIYRDNTGYNIGYDKDLTTSGILTDVTLSGLDATLGTAPKLVDWKNTSNPIHKDLIELSKTVEIGAKYTSGLYLFVKAELSSDKKTLTLYYELKTLDGESVSYVLDYGLPVQIKNLKAIIAELYDINADAITLDEVLCETALYGEVEMGEDKDSFTYTPTFFMNGVETVTVIATVGGKTGESVVLNVYFIPATNIYYEESFFTDTKPGGYELSDGNNQLIEWETVGTTSDLFQSADGVGSMHPYGYDDVYANGLGLSAGSALQVTVPFGTELADCPKLTFEFVGTGFDIISRTGVDQGRIGVTIEQNGVEVHNYGVILRGDNELYQVPVMSVEGLEHGKYKVTITVYPPMKMVDRETHEERFLYGTAQGATFVLDGIRIYDPVDTTDEANSEVLEAYEADEQVVVNRQELRDLLINAGEEITTTVDQDEGGSAADLNGFIDVGPNNEVYLAPGQSVSFTITLQANEKLSLRGHTMVAEATGTILINGSPLPASSQPTWNSGTDLIWEIGGEPEEVTVTVTVTNTSDNPLAGWIALTDIVITNGLTSLIQ